VVKPREESNQHNEADQNNQQSLGALVSGPSHDGKLSTDYREPEGSRQAAKARDMKTEN
jgi:hypothetical protein